MKKFCLTLMILLSGIFMLHSEYAHQMSKPLELQAAYGQVAYVSVTPLPSQGQAYIQGMPFNIEESYVLSTVYDSNKKPIILGSENGRLIANWSMISNSKVKLRITTTPMTHVSKESDKLNYYLHFTYLMGYSDGNNNVELDTQYFNIPMKENDPVSIMKTSDSQSVYEVDPFEVIADFTGGGSSYIGSLDGGIYFQFDENSSQAIYNQRGIADSSNIPAGNYTANVTIELISEG